MHRRGEVELPVEPGLDGVSVGRGHVGQVVGHERTDVAGEHVAGEGGFRGRLGLMADAQSPSSGEPQHQRCCEREVEGRGIEKETPVVQPRATTTLTLALTPGRYEAYCPVGEDSHKKLGMLAHLEVTGGTRRYGTPSAEAPKEEAESKPPRALSITGGGPVVQILPGPFPFADSAAAVIRGRPMDQQADLTHKEQEGPYSNRVARIAGTASISAWDLGPTRDSVAGTAEFKTQDGASWRVVMDRVQTKDIPFNPRFGGVIMGLYYHGASGVHTPLVPTIRSAVVLWRSRTSIATTRWSPIRRWCTSCCSPAPAGTVISRSSAGTAPRTRWRSCSFR